MYAFRRFRAAVLAASLSVLALGAFAAPAHAHHPYSGSYCRDRAYYCNTLQYYPTARIYSRCYRTTPCFITYNTCLVPVRYPVTLYGVVGRPVGLYQTNYTAFLR
jgi:hypothetical protein